MNDLEYKKIIRSCVIAALAGAVPFYAFIILAFIYPGR